MMPWSARRRCWQKAATPSSLQDLQSIQDENSVSPEKMKTALLANCLTRLIDAGYKLLLGVGDHPGFGHLVVRNAVEKQAAEA